MKANSVRVSPLLKMAVPLFLESFLRMFLGSVDQWMLSSYSDLAVAAVGNANQILNMSFVALEMVGSATAIILTQYLGAGQIKGAKKLYTLSLAIIVAISLGLSALMALFHRRIFEWMHVPQELIADAGVYLLIVGGTLVFQGIFMGISAILHSHVLMKEIMFVSILINLVNVAANFVLINGYAFFPRLGVAGAAIATMLSRIMGAVLLAWVMGSKLHIRIIPEYLRHPDFELIYKLFYVGLPAAGDSISYNCMQLVLLALINTFGTVAVTAKVYAGTVLPFVYIFSSSLATAIQIKVGYLVGAKESDKAQLLVQKTTWIALAASLSLSLLLCVGSDRVFGIFTSDPQVLHLLRQVVLVDLLLEMGRAVNMVMIRALLSAGDVTYPLYCALVSMWCVGVFLGFLLGKGAGLGLVGVWIGMAADEWCRAAAFLVRWRGGRWKTKALL